MARMGYARVSTEDQTLDLQREALREAGCIDIYEEHASGARATRPELAAALRGPVALGIAWWCGSWTA